MEDKKQGKPSLFREKSLEAIESPEKLNDYLHVTSPGVWLILAVAIALLLGFTLWGIFGRIDTTVDIAVQSGEGKTVCYVPFEKLEGVTKAGSIRIGSETYPLSRDAAAGTVLVSEEMNPYLRLAGDLALGDLAVEMEIDAALTEGIYTGTVVTESLKPITLLFQ